ncbi:ribosomal protein S18-alanine N-acetyltransferase [Paraliomyxa miuraensis]|uniref:ribosomal protein S18-alanine N-acetyltransferase n=1 Tax=Paraliomyxa miuraensis TaxID=376150 RepID=UPI0022507DF4|nr:ribosomal protein S18-alanine N-acetyltransferase [Paraliomyxa miuraensis]MCX4242378.1 ribosomal protein S18-alanine N-acetyltransferase [Paraliomyxa miuraensis]
MSAADAVGRPATAIDLPALAALDAACFGNPWSLEDYRQELTRSFARLHVVEVAGVLVGMSCSWVVGDEAHLLRIATSCGERRRGRGRALLRGVLDHATAAGCQQVLLEVASSNEAALALYAAFGFVPIGRRNGYYAHPPDDAIVMRRVLSHAPSANHSD